MPSTEGVSYDSFSPRKRAIWIARFAWIASEHVHTTTLELSPPRRPGRYGSIEHALPSADSLAVLTWRFWSEYWALAHLPIPLGWRCRSRNFSTSDGFVSVFREDPSSRQSSLVSRSA